MGFGDDEEILQDFLVEAGEILEHLSEQLVDLEQKPDDKDLLNAIFRGFHTVKGGAGFLQLDAMVDCCHVTENLFDILRTGKRSVTSELMDVVLSALDCINAQFQEVSQFEKPTPAPPELIQALEALVRGEEVSGEFSHHGEPDHSADAADSSDEIAESNIGETVPLGGDTGAQEAGAAEANSGEFSEQEYEELLDAIDGGDSSASPQELSHRSENTENSNASDEITEDEFEALLDQLHGKKSSPGAQASAPSSSTEASQSTPASTNESNDSAGAASTDEITEDEFEALLDQLHGKGRGPVAESSSAAASPTPPPAPKISKPSIDNADLGASGGDNDLITEDEFEALLDQLHGKGKKPKSAGAATAKPADKNSGSPPPSKPASQTEKAAPAKAPQASTPKPSPAAKPKQAAAAAGGAASGPRSTPAGAAPKAKDNTPSNNVAAAETTVRVDTQRLDDIMNMVGELVLVRNRLVRLGVNSNDEALGKAVANLDVVTADLQTSVMKTRMQPIKKVFGRFPRVVRDLARNLKKEINLELQGEDTDLDKNLVEALADPLVHLVRNAVDHGIENPADREAAGKNRVGRVVLAAEQEGDHILLSISDDGAGMDPISLRQKSVEKGILDEDAAARLTDQEAFDLIFAPGFSTKVEISDVSGRGVGMDVVKTKITQLNGSIEITSKIGEGSRIIIKVPLTLAIMPTLMIMLEEQTFALPLVSVNEIFHMDLSKANIVDGQECLTIRNKAVPIFHLKRWLVHKHETQPLSSTAHVVIVSVGTQRVGFVVDQLIGQEEVVIKPLGKMLHGTPGMAGATITGDGTIALILDVPSMLKRYASC